jgi:hypothetical protein
MCFRWKRVREKNFKIHFACSCDLCGESFGTMEELIKHLGRHDIDCINRRLMDGYGTARCNTCWKSFTNVAAMEEHTCVSNISGLSPVQSSESLESVLIH